MPVIKVYCSEAEKRRIAEAAKDKGISESKFLNDAGREKLTTAPKTAKQ